MGHLKTEVLKTMLHRSITITENGMWANLKRRSDRDKAHMLTIMEINMWDNGKMG